MGRSVSTPTGAAVVAYAHVEHDEGDDFQNAMAWEDDLGNLSSGLRRAFPSLEPCEKWLDREDRAFLRNGHAYIGISEYCGLVAVWIVPRSTVSQWDDPPGTARQWAAQVERRFRRIVADTFGIELKKLGHMSNGEGLFQRVEAHA